MIQLLKFKYKKKVLWTPGKKTKEINALEIMCNLINISFSVSLGHKSKTPDALLFFVTQPSHFPPLFYCQMGNIIIFHKI